ncbi:hypothetical protein Ciccas_003769 [Cichlidogyrus casuarinus]|uniref:Uncharacterized protein n=1 Tax=Cichlidogyrus casuarinus TaxID=1844966 RepID=A0ABD2QDL5_9PLAT
MFQKSVKFRHVLDEDFPLPDPPKEMGLSDAHRVHSFLSKYTGVSRSPRPPEEKSKSTNLLELTQFTEALQFENEELTRRVKQLSLANDQLRVENNLRLGQIRSLSNKDSCAQSLGSLPADQPVEFFVLKMRRLMDDKSRLILDLNSRQHRERHLLSRIAKLEREVQEFRNLHVENVAEEEMMLKPIVGFRLSSAEFETFEKIVASEPAPEKELAML